MAIRLSDHFTHRKLLMFTVPSIAMMIFTSIYGVVDGFFISNYVGKIPFAAVNIVWPFFMIVATLGLMFGTGGSAIVAKSFGEGNHKKANEYFSLFIYVSLALGLIFTALGIIFIRPISELLGAKGAVLDNCVIYGRIFLASMPFFICQLLFQSFFITAEKPALGLCVTIAAGVTNMILDFLLVAVIPLGIVGAALATALAQTLAGLVPLIYFSRKNDSLLSLGKTKFDIRIILKACANGSSEFMSNVSMSLVSMLYNIRLLKYAGENGVAAYGVMMYVCFVFSSAFIGYSIGAAPIVSFHFGAKNYSELKGLLRKSLHIISGFALMMVFISFLLSEPLSKVFVGYDAELLALTIRGFKIFSLSFLFMGYAIYASGFFTALNDGLTSAIISFIRTMVFQIAAVIILPLIWDIDGIWYSIVVSEVMAVILSAVYLIIKRKKYNY